MDIVIINNYYYSSLFHYCSESLGVLGGVRLPPDTEIIKYTSSIGGPKIPGTTNRGRKKTISLDPPSVSVMPALSSTGMPIEFGQPFKSQVGEKKFYLLIGLHFFTFESTFRTFTFSESD